jgi:nucleotide-binding universal stress UspA family protein
VFRSNLKNLTAREGMFEHILIAADLTSAARVIPADLDDLQVLGTKHITLLYVPGAAQAAAGGNDLLSTGSGDLDRHAEDFRKKGLVVEGLVMTGYASGEIVRAAEEQGVDLIVIGARSHQLAGTVALGSTGSEILRRASVPVLLNPPPSNGIAEGGRLRRILLATDCSEAAAGLESVVRHLARDAWELTIVTVLNEERNDAGKARTDLEALRQRLGRSARIRIIESGRTSDGIAQVARETGANLVVVGRHGRGARKGKLLGSTVENLTRNLGLPILVVPEK